MWCVAELNQAYRDRMEDVLAVYERPLDEREPLLCLDEKPVVLRREVRAPIPAAPARVARRDSEYERRGTAKVFCAVEPKAGRHFAWPTPNRSAQQFAAVVRDLVGRYPEVRTIHLVMDNLNTRCRKARTDAYGEQEGGQLGSRLTPHDTPVHGSWLNQAEIEISMFSRQCLGTRRIPDLPTLQDEARAGNQQVNRQRVVIDWRFDRQAARKTFEYENNEISRSEY